MLMVEVNSETDNSNVSYAAGRRLLSAEIIEANQRDEALFSNSCAT